MSPTETPASLPAAQLLARALRQRLEMGSAPLFLSSLDRVEALGLVTRARVGATSRGAGAPTAAPRATAARGRGSATEAAPAAPAAAVAPAAPAAPAPSDRAGPPADTSGMDADALRAAVMSCTRCRLAGTRTQAVFADGNPDARVMVVGEAPGANEDRIGLPFVGAAGKLLDLMLASVDLSRADSVYICNVLKCRPPGNRNPQTDEIDTCSPYLRRQIELVEPEVLLAVGAFAGQLLTGRSDAGLGQLRGTVHSYQGVPLVVTYHPAALLRNRSWSRPTWDDLQLLRSVLDAR